VARPPVNAVYILWLRQLKRYFRSRARMIGSLGQPTLFLLALGFGLGPTFARAGRGDYVQFLAPGIVTMGILFAAVFSGIEIIWDRQFGFLKETLVAPVSRLKIVLGQTLGRATVALIQGSIVFLVCLAAGFRPAQPLLLPLALLFMALIAIMCTAIGTAVGSVLQDMQGFQLIINFIVLPLFFFSSALFPVPDLPGAGGSSCSSTRSATASTACAVRSPAVSCSASRPTSRSLAASPRSYSRSVLTCSPRSRCSRRPDDQFSHLT
jgi:ABC-2 type transport system permease protein